MKNRLLTITLCFLSIFKSFTQNPSDLSAKLEAVLKEATDKDVFSGTALVVQNGEIIFQKAVGMADIQVKRANMLETTFSIGSITKFFTNTMIQQLVEEKKLDLSDNIGKYLTGFSNTVGPSVTISHLLQHQSGLGDYAREELPNSVKSVEDILNLIRRESLAFQPGTNTAYSNSGFVVLAAIIEKITGKTYAENLKIRIFNKIGMKKSGFGRENAPIEGKATGYMTNQPGDIKDNTRFNMIAYGDGGIYSNIGDLNLFFSSFLKDNTLLSDESKLRMIKQPGMSRTYATWTEFIEKGGTGFAGGAPGLNAVVIMMPAKKYHFILLSNYDEGTAEQVATRFTAILNNKNPEPFGTKPSEIPTVLYDFIKKNGQTGFHDFYISTFKKSGIPLDNDMILLHAGQRFLEEKNADGAIALYSVYTQDFPQIIVAKNDLADAYLLKGDKENAIKWYKKALELRPNNPRAKEALKRLGQ